MSLNSVPPQHGILHTYGFNLTAFEFNKNFTTSENILLFVGGLGNGLLNVPYLPRLAKSTEKLKHRSWNLVQVLLSSAYSGWGTSSLDKDVAQLQKCIKYFRSQTGGSRKRIVLMGHSTGCQDSIHYLTKVMTNQDLDEVYSIDGAILQAPISDAEALKAEDKEKLIEEVHTEYISKNKGNDLLPEKYRRLMFNTPITAYRFYSLVSKNGDDDYFSSYLTQKDYEQTFGIINRPFLILYGESDEFVPNHVDKTQLINEWKLATPEKYWSEYSTILSKASHDLSGSPEETFTDLINAVSKFINSLY